MAKNISIEKIAEVYKKKGCNITAACAALNITRQTFYTRKAKSKKLQELIEEADESMLDFAESKLIEHINNNDITSLIFFLKTKGKKRGYVERTEHDVNANPFQELMESIGSDED
jgi:conserved domain protein|nr:MAG TPA: Sf6 terminase small subunit gp1, octamer, DNA-binding, CAPS buffer.65A [Caudoviricetes sp.]